ncbi:hypothetical protein [Kitasatospora purpeofusca]|uniref:hypothetical protein n=1 Tax=Kitasatospora purpeofusca TaxID=67352 RepID=UPI003870036E|nr:hypothetical protein OIP63_02315 [Kitasatospora purpeofusca]
MTTWTGRRTAVVAALTAGALLGAAPVTASARTAPAAPIARSTAAAAPTPTVLQPGLPGKVYSDPTGVNNGGFVVGYAYGSGQVRDAAAIRWSPDLTPTTLPPLPGEDYAEARGVNDANLAIGISWPASRDYSRATAVRWAADGTPTALLPLPGDLYSRPTAIGGSGIVVGISGGGAAQRAVAWRPDGTVVALAPLPGDATSETVGVNSAGVAIGRSYTGTGKFHGVVWSPDGTPVPFQTGPTGGSGDWPVGINDAGTVIGVADRPLTTGVVRHGLVRSSGGAILDLGANAEPLAINGSGAVAGRYRPDPSSLRTSAARWSPDGTLTPLALSASSAAKSVAVGINDSGTAIGYAWDGIPARQDQAGKIWAPDGTLTDLDPTGTTNTTLFVNNAGLVVGLSLIRWGGSLYPAHLATVWRS